MGDRIQLEQVLLNLLQNSLDSIEQASSGLRRIEVETDANGSEGVTVSVRDTGVGLKPDEVEQMFERFYSSKPKGMGMGLAISRSIIEAHNGRLWAEENADGGAAFRFCLPKVS